MATAQRFPVDLVEIAEIVRNAPHKPGFFPLVAFLERLTADAVRVGELGPVSEECIRFRHDPDMGFSSSDVSSLVLREVNFRPDDPEARRPLFEVTSTFLGLTGSATPLPLYMAEEAAQEDSDNGSLREFLDLFHHRLLSLLYRIECRYRVTRELTAACTDQWSRRILALAGFDTYERAWPGLLPPWRLLRVAPLLISRVRTAERLEMALQDVLAEELEGARVTVRQFVGRWVDIDARTKLGRAYHQLGRNMLLGSRAFDRMGRFQVEIGPLTQRAYRRLMADGDLYPLAREVISLFVRDPLEYTFELFLAESVTHTFKLSSGWPSQLGRDTWLGTNRQNRLTVTGAA